VIGDRDSVLGFTAVGISVFPVISEGEAVKLLHELEKEEYAVIYITEQIASKMMTEIDSYKDKELPAIILIPGNQGSLGIGILGVKKSVERAVGADILFNKD
ncbi:MAG: V-type synthase subunit, partial [Clostridia bacterium]|nr:V-type synthase subunit [Clostridia bacterium]